MTKTTKTIGGKAASQTEIDKAARGDNTHRIDLDMWREPIEQNYSYCFLCRQPFKNDDRWSRSIFDKCEHCGLEHHPVFQSYEEVLRKEMPPRAAWHAKVKVGLRNGTASVRVEFPPMTFVHSRGFLGVRNVQELGDPPNFLQWNECAKLSQYGAYDDIKTFWRAKLNRAKGVNELLEINRELFLWKFSYQVFMTTDYGRWEKDAQFGS